uniref:ABC transporter ATP-binding protein n=1 Tax=endosymbiont of Ridgeia piscesae TaxID=54398 RepID=D2CL06_9GAMM|nr:ABC transporter ATP-binding protein [endosymbiont of Ridgeia piscesae]
MVFQSYALFPHMTVLQNVAYGLTVKNMPKPEAHAKAEQGLEMVGLAGFGQRLPSELSGGQQQRVAVARAIVLEPEVLLLDEPLSNLDAKLRRHVREEIRQIQQELSLTAVYVTHDQEEAMAVSDRIIVMRNAEIAQEGTPHDLYERPNSTFIADFIGDANLVDCDVLEATKNGSTIRVAGKTVALKTAYDKTGPAKLVLRPNHFELSQIATEHSFEASITYAAYLGNQIQYSMSGELGDIFMISETVAQPYVMGDNVQIHISPDKAMLVEV